MHVILSIFLILLDESAIQSEPIQLLSLGDVFGGWGNRVREALMHVVFPYGFLGCGRCSQLHDLRDGCLWIIAAARAPDSAVRCQSHSEGLLYDVLYTGARLAGWLTCICDLTAGSVTPQDFNQLPLTGYGGSPLLRRASIKQS